ncbi:MAG: DUF362 domain-containing protein [Desulfobacteraceae bacterium]|nr:DUF362 domain-containing protein [Desulfobacteraceae bacterium]
MHHFSIHRISNDLEFALKHVISDADLFKRIGNYVFIKPNFTFPFFKPGVTTTREIIVALIECLVDCGCKRICIGEGEGGYNSFSINDTFKSYQFEKVLKKYGVEVANVTDWPKHRIKVLTHRGKYELSIPAPIIDEFDTFITLPVPKVHAMTTITNSLKNQWGIIQDKMRLRYHIAFNEIITEINLILPNPIAIVDGSYGLTKNGPMIEGDAIKLGWVSACDNLWLNDMLICKLMNIPLRKVDHLMYAKRLGLIPKLSDCRISRNFNSFIDNRFYLQRNIWNYVTKLTWHSPLLAELVYSSKISGLLHKIMYSIRKKPSELKVKGIDWND